MENVGNNVLQQTDNLATSGRMSYISASVKDAGSGFSKIFDSIMSAQTLSKDVSSVKERANGADVKSGSTVESKSHNDLKDTDSAKLREPSEDDTQETEKKDICIFHEDAPVQAENELQESFFAYSKEQSGLNILSYEEQPVFDGKVFADGDSLTQTFAEDAELSGEIFKKASSDLCATGESLPDERGSEQFSFVSQDEADFDTSVFEKFAKSTSADFRQSYKSTAEGSNAQSEQSNLKDLMAKANVSEVKITDVSKEEPAVSNDFGASELSVIEDSIRASIMLEKSLDEKEISKSKIDAIMDSREQAGEETLNRSLQLLRGASSSHRTVLESLMANLRSAAQTQEPAAVNSTDFRNESVSRGLLNTVESAFKAQAKGIMAAQTSNQSGSSGSFEHSESNQSFSSGLLNQEKTVSRQMSKQFNLLEMSSNLRANAEELAKKVMQMASRNLKRMELNLNPEGLGKLKINLDIGVQDHLNRVTFQASSESTRELLEKSLGTLRSILFGSDIDADVAMEDYLDEKGGEGQFADGRDGRRGSGHSADEKDEQPVSASLEDELNDSFAGQLGIA